MKKLKINENDLIINEDFSLFFNLDRVLVDNPDEERNIEIEFVEGQGRYKFINYDGYFFILRSGFTNIINNTELKKMKKYNRIYNVVTRL